MSAISDSTPRRADFPTGKVIRCVVPDDGTDKRLLAELREKHGIVRASSAARRGIGALASVKTKRGKLPEPLLVKELYVLCTDDQADEVFGLIFWSAQLDKPGRGLIWQQAASGCIPFDLPADIPDEEAGV